MMRLMYRSKQSYLCADPKNPEESFANTFVSTGLGFDKTDLSMQNVGCGVYFGDASGGSESDYEFQYQPCI